MVAAPSEFTGEDKLEREARRGGGQNGDVGKWIELVIGYLVIYFYLFI